MTIDEKYELFVQVIGYPGRMISGSKSAYRNMYPDNEVVFNSNIATMSDNKFWWGDIDITKEKEKLINLRNQIGEDIYIFSEMAMRFENQNASVDEAINSMRAGTYYQVKENSISKFSKGWREKEGAHVEI